MAGRRSEVLLGALAFVALANGVLFGLSVYGVLAAGLRLIGQSAPPFGYALALGIFAGVAVLLFAQRRERKLRESHGAIPGCRHHVVGSGPLKERFDALVATSSLEQAPMLVELEKSDPNAYAVGRPPNEATVVVTSKLLSLLDESEQEAALAYQLAQLESGEIQAAARADAVADSVEAFSFFKGRVFWSPKDILQYGLPFYLVFLLLLVVMAILPQQPVSGEIDFGGFLLLLLFIAGGLGLLALMAASAFWSLPALFQLFLLVTFVGPLTLIEMALALPTVLALTRLLSRARIGAGDRRSVELTGDRPALLSALEKLDAAAPVPEPGEAEPFWDPEGIESFWSQDRTRLPPNRAWLGYPRFALFVAPRARKGFRAWLGRFYTTHPSISSRIEALDADPAQDGSRAPLAAGQPGAGSAQSG